ncbi:MAG TPA: TIGR00725 family protein [Cyclobacteriaceae bacterium]|nr:TIGR00725 family protein [Cyclobacteriaceae bacterium]HMV10804.1 TIGR00725 family protein [Cyclobacteriaceae bacterium]HMV88763.1 TIGR00725 family protein [Cyclobacteriaceae bacterium]HMX02343.1 TIGR00725 family protein [Cyclobacteriaceae bacterium]HMX51714.1 TIGR00725 family protein [Cyclobacteriaceae bacterium]
MGAKIIVGLMGPGETATPEQNEDAFELGAAIAKQGWILLTGGRAFGVMEASMRGASVHHGLTIGILPGDNAQASSPYAQIRIVTGMGSARNNINVLTSHVIVVCGMASGTASEVSLALRANKRIIFLRQDKLTIEFFKKLGTHRVVAVESVGEVIEQINDFISLKQIV